MPYEVWVISLGEAARNLLKKEAVTSKKSQKLRQSYRREGQVATSMKQRKKNP